MSIVLTFFKKRGSQEADDFRGVIGYRGCPLSEWDYLTLDSQLKEIGVKLVVREYANATELDQPYNTLVKKPICLDLRYNEGKSEQYPDKGGLTSTDIRTWILSVLKAKRPDSLNTSTDEIEQTDSAVSRDTSSTANSNNSKAPVPLKNTGGDAVPGEETKDGAAPPQQIEDVDETSRLLGLGIGLAGTLLVAAFAVAGGIGGSLLADRVDNEETVRWVDGEEGEVALIVDGPSDEEGRVPKIDFAAQERVAKAKERAAARKAKQESSGRKAWEEAAPEATTSVNAADAPKPNELRGDL